MTAKGYRGEIVWVYLPAVTFGPWSYVGQGKTGTLTAQIVSRDEFRLQQQPLDVVVPAGRAEWRWRVSDLQISGTTLTASVVRL
jgi:hypothetical protein